MKETSQPRQIVVWGGGYYLDNNRKPEDLKRFNKNKKQKEIIIGSIIAIVMIIGGISLYRSFAMYEERKTFDVLKGTVPDFSSGDITLAYTIDGQKVSGKGFPNKNSGYAVKDVNCENEVTADWDNRNWSLENIRNPQNAPKIKCNIDFAEIYTEKELNGADPVLSEELVPVEIGDNGTVKKADIADSWYSYADKQWANAVILVEGKTAEDYKDNAEIPEKDIESYFVWIPKYSYKLFDEQLGKYENASGTLDSEKQNRAIEIKFGLDNTKDNGKIDGEPTCKTPMLSNEVQGASGSDGNCSYQDYMTHPAFLAFGGNGLWVGKFETGYKGATSTSTAQKNENNSKQVVIKPNEYSWRSIVVANMYQTSFGYKRELESHMMKNTEWGAVAYLAQSVYGRCTIAEDSTTTCEKVKINNNSSMITGYVAKDEPTTGYGNYKDYEAPLPLQDGTKTYNYTNQESVHASTTGNYSGIYDMSGSAWEYVMGVINKSGNSAVEYSQSGLNSSILNDPKYYDVYNYGADYTHWERRILGDATGENGPFVTTSEQNVLIKSSWFYAQSVFPLGSSHVWFIRGGQYLHGYLSGIFSFSDGSGSVHDGASFRIVLAIKTE